MDSSLWSVWSSYPYLCLQTANKSKNNPKGMRTGGSKRKNTTQRRQARDLATVADTRPRRFQPFCYGFPDRLVSTLRYHTTNVLSSVAGSIQQYGFRWNSIFDPDYTSAGHQPLYRDTYAGIYDQYAVLSARATITFSNLSSTANVFIAVNTDDDSSPSTDINTLAEQSHGMSTILGSNSGNRAVHIIDTAWDCKKVLGIDPYASESYKTSVASNPTEASYLWITAEALNATNADVMVNVLMEFDVLFTELATPTQS